MKYFRAKKNPDHHGEEYTNAFFDLFVVLGMYSKFLSEWPYGSFEDYLTLDVNVDYMQNNKLSLYCKGSKYIRDFMKDKGIKGISANGVRRIGWKPEESIVKLPRKTPLILEEVFSHINDNLRVQGLNAKAYEALFNNCHECNDFPYHDPNEQCVNHSLGIHKIALEQAKCKLKAHKAKIKIIAVFQKMAVTARCGNGGP